MIYTFFILFYPIIYISESHFNTSGFNIAKPKLLYTLYSRLTGYPKVLEIKDSKEKYILVGYDSNNYYVYNLKLTLNYVDNINESSLKLCKNLTRPINNTDGEILYEILSESEYNYPSNINFLNIKKSDVVILPFTFENINLSKDKIINNCNQLLKNKNK